jgi:arginine decarboxylase
VELADNGRWRIDHVVEGETIRDVLAHVQYDTEDIRRRIRSDIEASIEANRITIDEGKALRRFLDDSLQGYTYLE